MWESTYEQGCQQGKLHNMYWILSAGLDWLLFNVLKDGLTTASRTIFGRTIDHTRSYVLWRGGVEARHRSGSWWALVESTSPIAISSSSSNYIPSSYSGVKKPPNPPPPTRINLVGWSAAWFSATERRFKKRFWVDWLKQVTLRVPRPAFQILV